MTQQIWVLTSQVCHSLASYVISDKSLDLSEFVSLFIKMSVAIEYQSFLRGCEGALQSALKK